MSPYFFKKSPTVARHMNEFHCVVASLCFELKFFTRDLLWFLSKDCVRALTKLLQKKSNGCVRVSLCVYPDCVVIVVVVAVFYLLSDAVSTFVLTAVFLLRPYDVRV